MQEQPARIKIAVQKSGRLTEHSMDLLTRCGLSYSRGRDQLICYGENMPVDVLLVRDDDIPRLVQEDVCDLGIVGINVIEEARLDLEANGVTDLSRASTSSTSGTVVSPSESPPESIFRGPVRSRDCASQRATRRIVEDYLRRERVDASVVEFSGAVEIAPSLGKADLICDLVSSGGTMRAHQLVEVETILESRAALIQTPVRLADEKAIWVQRLLQRIEGVRQVAESKYIMLHAPRRALDAIRLLLPGSEAPTIMPLEGRDDKVAMHAVCRENIFWETLEDLKDAGASSILVLPVEKMLA